MLVDSELTNKVVFKVLLASVFKVKPEIIEKLGPATERYNESVLPDQCYKDLCQSMVNLHVLK
jgi:hypothetical protein